MLTFRQFLKVITLNEDFKSSQIIKVNVSGREIEVSYDKIPTKKINFTKYIGTFPKSREIFRGVLFFVKGELFHLCWNELLTHTKMLELLKPKIPDVRLLYIYNNTYHSEAGDKIADDYTFNYEIVNGVLRATLEPDTLQELEKQKNISKTLGFSKEYFENLVDNCGT